MDLFLFSQVLSPGCPSLLLVPVPLVLVPLVPVPLVLVPLVLVPLVLVPLVLVPLVLVPLVLVPLVLVPLVLVPLVLVLLVPLVLVPLVLVPLVLVPLVLVPLVLVPLVLVLLVPLVLVPLVLVPLVLVPLVLVPLVLVPLVLVPLVLVPLVLVPLVLVPLVLVPLVLVPLVLVPLVPVLLVPLVLVPLVLVPLVLVPLVLVPLVLVPLVLVPLVLVPLVLLGLFREVVRVPEGQLHYQHAKRLAAEIIERKAPDCSVVGMGEKILLFRHQPGSEHLLHRLTDQDALQDRDLIEVIISGLATVTEVKIRPHSLAVQSYRTPTFCHHCGEMLWGLVRQGLKCEDCGLDFHKRCALQLPNDCSRSCRRVCGPSMSLFPSGRTRTHSLSMSAGGSLEEISMSKPRSRPPSWADHPVWLGVGRSRVPHTFHVHNYTKPTVCQHCRHLLKGLFRQGLQCSDCKLNCHRRCEALVQADCPGERKMVNGEAGHIEGAKSFKDEEDDTEEDTNGMNCSMTSPDDELITEDPFAETSHVVQQPPITPCFSSYIPLMRVVQSVRHTKRRGSGVLREGWLLHHTNTDTLRKRHYWILDWKSITLYQNESCTKYYKEIPLSEVLQVRGPGQLSVTLSPGNSDHCFEVVTSALVYCVLTDRDRPAWENAIHGSDAGP
ncbi:hypothetical protein DPEC_G00094950 [Dallia pectoralis]|uniref:Uncharacterized protein n=1 Tax=Dallia pectoralis TaxID=75939 RepID=A0ACC2GVF7_DALPE|nr:hypothetical protein DPEC_G00094950 [Dallia pectoralis]